MVDEQMNDEQLQQWVEHISLESFGRPFRHKATFNGRLRTTGGRYFMQSHNIEISRKQYERFGREEIEKIIKHELCHYHLHIMGRGYRHRDADFKVLLRQVGGSRYCQAIPEQRLKRKPLPYRYRLICKGCGKEYMRKRRVDTKKYACGICRGRLRMTELEIAGG